MKKALFGLILVLTFWPVAVFASAEGDALRKAKDALVVIKTTCIYTLKLNMLAESIKTGVLRTGNGFFFESENQSPRIFTVAHFLRCPSDSPEEWNKFLTKIDITRELVESFELSKSVSVEKDGWEYEAKILKISADIDKEDYGILIINTRESPWQYSLPVISPQDSYDLLDRVVIYGFTPLPDGSYLPRAQSAAIESIDEHFIYVGATSFEGSSGTAALLWKDGRYYAIGILKASAYSLQSGKDWGFTIVTRIKPLFLK